MMRPLAEVSALDAMNGSIKIKSCFGMLPKVKFLEMLLVLMFYALPFTIYVIIHIVSQDSLVDNKKSPLPERPEQRNNPRSCYLITVTDRGLFLFICGFRHLHNLLLSTDSGEFT